MLKNTSLEQLKGKKNLLAFSGGADSSALFFILKQNNIEFDIAIVNYGIREQSKEEVAYAQNLACENVLTCHTLNAPKIEKNFEASARELRYNFFHTLIAEHKYDNLLTAHHLGDRFEWMLMQFCKGSGCLELASMQEIEHRDHYTLIRPLLHLDKSELLEFLKQHEIQFFEDETNKDESIKRNYFRHQHAKPLLQKYMSGIKKSFEYIDEDKSLLAQEIEIIKLKGFAYFKSSLNKRADIFAIDKYLKENSHMPSASERELLKQEKTVVLGREFVVNQEHGFVFITRYITQNSHMPKEFKEECRVLKIEPKLRAFLYENQELFTLLKSLLGNV